MSGDDSIQKAKQENARLHQLQQVVLAVSSELNLKKCLETIMDATVEISDAERGFLMLKTDNELSVEVARNMDKEAIYRPSHKFSRTAALRSASTGEPMITPNAMKDKRFSSAKSVATLKLKSVICVPLMARGEILGVIYLDNRFKEGAFGADDVELLEAFAAQAGIAIENARLYQRQVDRQREVEALNDQLNSLNQRLNRQLNGAARHLDELLEPPDIEDEPGPRSRYPEIVGRSPAILDVLFELDRMVESDLSVLIMGENGTGKELIARAIHQNGSRSSEPFVAENCASFTESLLESELFGHVKGAFTGADLDRTGLLELADGGTLFLDEVGDMGLQMQARLLRFLQEGIVRRVGGKEYRQVDVRIVSATNKDLKKLIREGRFRADLYYRLKIFTVILPPLRERSGDVLVLARHFLAKALEDRELPTLTNDACRALEAYSWPGNVRELENEMLRLVASRLAVIDLADLSPDIAKDVAKDSAKEEMNGAKAKGTYRQALRRLEIQLLTDTLKDTQWNVSKAARRLGMARMTLTRRIEKYGIKPV